MSTRNNNPSRPIRIDPNNVPEVLRPLIPYAGKWSITDDVYRDKAIDEASLDELRDLIAAVSRFGESIDEWLGDPGTAEPTREWISFVLLIDACDLAKLRLQSENGNSFTKGDTS